MFNFKLTINKKIFLLISVVISIFIYINNFIIGFDNLISYTGKAALFFFVIDNCSQFLIFLSLALLIFITICHIKQNKPLFLNNLSSLWLNWSLLISGALIFIFGFFFPVFTVSFSIRGQGLAFYIIMILMNLLISGCLIFLGCFCQMDENY